MKPTPRRAENVVAAQFTEIFAKIGLPAVERVPVIGRRGPDISFNTAKIIVDVKSRKSAPAAWLVGPGEIISADGLVGFRISDVGNLETLRRRATKPSKTVRDWLTWMDEWRQEYCPDGISAMVIRRPGMGRHASTVIIYEKEFHQWIKRTSSL
jgi:hypothetical protein